MKILVTGASGFIGRHLVERLLARGQTDLRCLVRRPRSEGADVLARLASGYPAATVEIEQGSLEVLADAVLALRDVELVYHLAAGTNGEYEEIWRDTVIASQNLLAAMRQRGAGAGSEVLARLSAKAIPKTVLVSSFAVYGTATLPRGTPLTETSPLESRPHLRDPYARAKLRQEEIFLEQQREVRFPLVIVRPGVVYGPGGTAISPRVGLQTRRVFLLLGGSNILPLTYVENCADAIAMVGLRPEADGAVYNVVDDQLISAREWLRLYRDRIDRIPYLTVPYRVMSGVSAFLQFASRVTRGRVRAPISAYRVATTWGRGGKSFTNAKLRSLGWTPRISTEEGLRTTFEAFAAARSSGVRRSWRGTRAHARHRDTW